MPRGLPQIFKTNMMSDHYVQLRNGVIKASVDTYRNVQKEQLMNKTGKFKRNLGKTKHNFLTCETITLPTVQTSAAGVSIYNLEPETEHFNSQHNMVQSEDFGSDAAVRETEMKNIRRSS